MRKNVLIAAATICLLSACGEQAVENEAVSSATNNATATPAATENSGTPASPASKEEALKLMHERHEGMEKIGKATKAIGAQLKEENPNVGTIRTNATTINELAAKSANWFPTGTGPDVGKTRAKAEIWQKYDDFAAKDRDFRLAAQALKGSAESTDVNAIKPAFATLGKACKACHDPYRSEKKQHD
jgi:cytochrome c556